MPLVAQQLISVSIKVSKGVEHNLNFQAAGKLKPPQRSGGAGRVRRAGHGPQSCDSFKWEREEGEKKTLKLLPERDAPLSQWTRIFPSVLLLTSSQTSVTVSADKKKLQLKFYNNFLFLALFFFYLGTFFFLCWRVRLWKQLNSVFILAIFIKQLKSISEKSKFTRLTSNSELAHSQLI